MLTRRIEYPNTVGLILRRTYPELYKSHIIKLFEEYPVTRDWYVDRDHELRLPNGSRLFFGSAEHEKDMASFYSAEFADVLVDEAQEFSQGELERLSGSVRCTSNPTITPKMAFTFMPGVSESGVPPKGLPYLKRVFVDKKLQGEEKRQRWGFIQAFAWDNIEWARASLQRGGVSEAEFYSWDEQTRREYFLEYTDFGATLAAISNASLRQAWLEGSWGVFEGQYFPNFAFDRHTIPAEFLEIQKWHKRWISMDWGDDHPLCVHWHTENEDGVVTTYRELWGREIGESNIGKMISQAEAEDVKAGYRKLEAFYLSWDAFGKLNKQTKKSIVEMIGNALSTQVPKPTSAGNDAGSRISGWRLMDQLIDANLWRIVRESDDGKLGCPKLIECLPTLVRDMERNSEDVLKVDYSENYIGDDPADCARYGLQNMLRKAILPAVKVAENKVKQYAEQKGKEVEELDINTVAQLHRRALAAEQRKRRSRRGGLGKIWRPPN